MFQIFKKIQNAAVSFTQSRTRKVFRHKINDEIAHSVS